MSSILFVRKSVIHIVGQDSKPLKFVLRGSIVPNGFALLVIILKARNVYCINK